MGHSRALTLGAPLPAVLAMSFTPAGAAAPAGPDPSPVDPSPAVPTLDALRAGDHAAWEAQYRAAYPGLLAYAQRRLDPDDARDAVSETMVRAVQTVGRFEERGVSFGGWLYGILRHVVSDIRRKEVRRLHRARPDEEVAPGEPVEGLIEREEVAAVRRAFERLDAADQELLELRVVRALSADDVAVILGKRSGAVRMGQMRALQRLRQELECGDAD